MAATDPGLSPLVEVERRVQARAKEISLEMGTDGGRSKLRVLIEEEVAAWGADFRRGRRDFDLADPTGVAERAFRNLTGYGPVGGCYTPQHHGALTSGYASCGRRFCSGDRSYKLQCPGRAA